MKFQNIVLIGGGVLGSQIAYQTAYAGFHTNVYLRSEASVERAKPKVARLHEIYRAELTAAGADALAEVPEDILRYVQEQNK